MHKLSPIRFGTALGLAGAAFYVGCIMFMAIAPDAAVVWIVNSFLHGIDVQSIMRENVPLQQSLAGILGTFISGLLFGIVSAWIYNLGRKRAGAD